MLKEWRRRSDGEFKAKKENAKIEVIGFAKRLWGYKQELWVNEKRATELFLDTLCVGHEEQEEKVMASTTKKIFYSHMMFYFPCCFRSRKKPRTAVIEN